MNEDAFARRFYADRSELEALGILLSVEKPVDGLVEQETYSLAARELPPAADRVHRRGAGGAAHRAAAPRRGIRLRRAAAARAPADLLGTPQPPERPGAEHGRARHHRLGRRPRRLAAAGQDRDRDLPPQDHRVRLLHDGARRAGHAQGRPVPAAVPGRASSTWSGARTSATRSACSGCRGSAARSATRPRPSTTSSAQPTSTRAPTPTGSTGSSASPIGTAEIWIGRRIAWQIERHFGRYGEMHTPRRQDGDQRVRHLVRQRAPADRLGAGPGRARADPRARPSWPSELRERVELLIERHTGDPQIAGPAAVQAPDGAERPDRRRARLRQRPPPRRRDPP